MSSAAGRGPDLSRVSTREEFAAALTALRRSAGLTVRQVVERSGALHGTVSGWFAGQHLPTEANERMFRDVLGCCGVPVAEQDSWLAALRRVRPTTGRRREAGELPYRGLAAFAAEDAAWFFGRADATAELFQRVEALRTGSEPARVLIVVGASGSGKSSLLRAGLVPLLCRHGRSVAVLRPGTRPAAALAAAPTVDVLIVDQFEEAWTQCQDLEQRREFFDAITGSRTGCVYVLGLRADFYRQVAEEAELLDALAAHAMLVRPLTSAALREVIVEPARKAKWTVEEELVHLLLVELAPHGSAAAHDVGALPLLSHALLETWRHSTRRRMTVADYLATGGIGGAVQQSAEAVYTTLTDRQRELARRAFLRLVSVEEELSTRRRVQHGELFFDTESVADVETVIERFAAHRLLTVDEDTIEISHEALIGGWRRLTDWINTDRTGLLVHRRLTQATRTWLDADREPGALLGTGRLALMREWAETDDHDTALNRDEREYLRASIAHQEELVASERRRTRILRRLVAGLALALVVAMVLAGVALIARSTANRARDEARSRQIAVQSATLRAKDPALAAQLALAAYRVHPTLEARSAVLDASATHTPVRLLGAPGGALIAADATGEVFAVGRQDRSVMLYERMSRTPLRSLAAVSIGSEGATRLDALAVDRAGRRLAAATDRGIHLWDIADRDAPAPLAVLGATAVPVKNLAFSPDGAELAGGGLVTNDVHRWTVSDPARPVARPPLVFPTEGSVVAYSPDGLLLAAGGAGAALRIWDRRRDGPTPVHDSGPDGSTDDFTALSFHPTGTVLAAGGRGRDVRRWSVADPARPVGLPTLTGFTSYVNDLAYSPDGDRLAATSSDNTTRIWATDGDLLEDTLPNPVIVVSVVFVGDGTGIVTGGIDGAARVWPLPGPVLRGARSVVYQMPMDRTGTRLLVGTGAADSHPRLWDLSEPDAPVEYSTLGVGPEEQTTGAVALAADGSVAAVGARTGRVHLWDLGDPRQPRHRAEIPGVRGLVSALAFDPDATLLVVAGQDERTVTLWDVGDIARPAPLGTLDVGPGLPSIVAIDPSGTLLAVATSHESVRLWDITDRRRPREVPSLTGFGNDVASVAFGPRDGLLAAAGADRTVRLFGLADPDEPRRLAVLRGPADAVITLNFSPDGTRVAGGGGGGGIWVWDITDPRAPSRAAVLNGYEGRVNEVVYGHGGALLAAGGPAMTVQLWATDPDRVAAELCGGGNTPLTAEEWERYLPGVPAEDLCTGS
ncbi:hypothetical protein [Nocardia sp. CC201C]|uniref:nSTAND1 domain-containing NTPase n=1 Tax=Nocardia sp. CC201C TaxID=3044575 RepID=UPI0024A7B950|nr:hypothetical protein [Nocardia sp. CC201C]